MPPTPTSNYPFEVPERRGEVAMTEKEYLELLSSQSAVIKKLEKKTDYLKADLNEKEVELSLYKRTLRDLFRYKKSISLIIARLLKNDQADLIAHSEAEYNRSLSELSSLEAELGDLKQNFLSVQETAKTEYPVLDAVFKSIDERVTALNADKQLVSTVTQDGYECLKIVDELTAVLEKDDFLEIANTDDDEPFKTSFRSPAQRATHIHQLKARLKDTLHNFYDECLLVLPDEKKPPFSDGFLEWLSDSIENSVGEEDVDVQAVKTLQLRVIDMIECLIGYRTEIENNIGNIVFY